MKKLTNILSRVLMALLLCTGFVFVGCTEGLLGDKEDNGPATLTLSKVTATTATITGHLDVPASDLSFSQVTVYYSDAETFNINAAECVSATSFDNHQNFTITLTNLKYGTKYNYCMVAEVKSEKTYGDVLDFTTSSICLVLSAGSITATSAQITGTVDGLSESDMSLIEVGMLYSSEAGKVDKGEGTKLTASEISSDNAFYFDLSDLMFGTKYYYCSYVKQGEGYVYGEVKEFVAGSVSVNLSAGSITATTAQITGTVEGLSESDKSLIEVGLLYSSESGQVENGQGTKLAASEIPSDNAVSFALSDLTFCTKYYYCSYVKQGDGYVYGEVKTFDTIFDLSATSTANCYIISQSGSYCFWTVKGNNPSELLHLTESASLLWESFGTSTAPGVGDLVKSVSYKDGYIVF